MNDHQKAIVLIADAVPDNLLWLSSLLHEHYDVRLAADGHAVLRIVQEVPRPDVLLIDAALPEIDGLEVCRQLKRIPDTAGIPVLLAVAQAMRRTSSAALRPARPTCCRPRWCRKPCWRASPCSYSCAARRNC